MLRTVVPKLCCPSCRDRNRFLTAQAFVEGTEGHIQNGVLICEGCSSWYPIEDDLLEFVTSALRDPDNHQDFGARFRRQLERLNLSTSGQQDMVGKGVREQATIGESQSDETFGAQLEQRQLFDWYAENARLSYATYHNSPFWVAADQVAFRRWRARLRPNTYLLDVGCADGRSTFPLVNTTNTVVGCDISRKMVRKAVGRAKELGVHGRTSFMVADAADLPFRYGCFDYVFTYGVLHHLPDPGRTCRKIERILGSGGIHFGSENNRSAFRWLFDLLMKLKPLWTEKAGTEPLISEHMIREWTRSLSVKINCSTSVFLPPHLFNLLGRQIAGPVLVATDRFMSFVPGLRRQGGLILFEIQKC